MSVSEARKQANRKWDKENMTTISCRVTRERLQKFKEACEQLGTVPNQVIQKAIADTIDQADKSKSRE